MKKDNIKEDVYLCICNYKLFNSFIEANNYYPYNTHTSNISKILFEL